LSPGQEGHERKRETTIETQSKKLWRTTRKLEWDGGKGAVVNRALQSVARTHPSLALEIFTN
jgi:hypothetical protein